MELKGDRRDRKRSSKSKSLDNRKSIHTIIEVIKKRSLFASKEKKKKG